MPPNRERSAEEADRRSTSVVPLDDLDDLADGKAKFAVVKCTRDVPTCKFCHEQQQDCVYTKVVRTPLTRRNLDAAEERIRRLEARLQEQNLNSEPSSSVHDRRSSNHSQTPHAEVQPASPRRVQPGPGSSPARPPVPAPSPFPANDNRTLSDPPPSLFGGSHPVTLAPPVLPSPAAPLHSAGPAQGSSRDVAFDLPPGASSSAAGTAPSIVSPAATSTVGEKDEDGMGSLTMDQDPHSSAYLGSLSGAGLLRFLQRCATDVDLASKALKSVTSPSSTITSSAPVSPEQLASYIEAYFSVFHLQYPLIHQAVFRAQLGDIVPRPGGAAWGLLYTTILALGSMCVADPGDGSETFFLYDKAVAQVTAAMFESSNLTAVQAFTLLANLSQKLNHVSQGTVFLGIALRMAINLGLHCEAAAKHLSLFEQEQRRRVWWTLFSFESGAALTFGHPSTLPTVGVDVWPVLNAPDTLFTPATQVRPAPSSGPTIYSSLFYQACFHQLAGQVLNRLTGNPYLPLEEVLLIYREVDAFQTSLPPFFLSSQPAFFDFARHKLAWRLDNLRMVVLRQTFLRVSLAAGPVSPDEEHCWSRCVDCAAEVIRSVQRFTSTAPRCVTELWYALHFIIPATFLPLIALRLRPSSPHAIDWLEVVQAARSVLESIPQGLLKPLATRCLTIIAAVANLNESAQPAVPEAPTTASLDADFTNFLEMLAGPMEMDGMPTQALQAPGLLPDLDTLFQWFTPSGSPQPR
ncbi:hypothetical protein JCM8202v2_004745 [Rhodotorula sphaerocarpa]